LTTVTKDAVTVTPLFVIGWQSAREARTVVHDILGKPTADFTLRPSGPRGGTLTYFFADLADAISCEVLHADAPGILVLSDTAIPGGTMAYVVTGDVSLVAANDEGRRWTLEVTYRSTT
jgi:hypothetical protein